MPVYLWPVFVGVQIVSAANLSLSSEHNSGIDCSVTQGDPISLQIFLIG